MRGENGKFCPMHIDIVLRCRLRSWKVSSSPLQLILDFMREWRRRRITFKCAFKPFALLFIDNALVEAGVMSDVVRQFWKLML